MSMKQSSNAGGGGMQQGRRAPLSLSGGGSKIPQSQQHHHNSQHAQHGSTKSSSSSNSTTNNSKPNVQKNDNNKPTATSANANVKVAEKKQEEKKVQNGTADKLQNGSNGVEKKTNVAAVVVAEKTNKTEKAANAEQQQHQTAKTEKVISKKEEAAVAADVVAGSGNAEKTIQEKTAAAAAIAAIDVPAKDKQVNDKKEHVAESKTNKEDKNAKPPQQQSVVETTKTSVYKPKPACKKTPKKEDDATANASKAAPTAPTARKNIQTAVEVAATTATAAAVAAPPPSATSTPGKYLGKNISEIQLCVEPGFYTPDRAHCPRTFASISGRRSIRSYSARETYRQINTDLDDTRNTSMNVTVGSDLPNNSSWSFWSRKRERTPPKHSQTQNDIELVTPQKRARTDNRSFLSIIRSRFSKTSIESAGNTPFKAAAEAVEEDELVQNVSGISDDSENNDVSMAEAVDDVPPAAAVAKEEKAAEEQNIEAAAELQEKMQLSMDKATAADDDNKEQLLNAEDDNAAAGKNKRCNVM